MAKPTATASKLTNEETPTIPAPLALVALAVPSVVLEAPEFSEPDDPEDPELEPDDEELPELTAGGDPVVTVVLLPLDEEEDEDEDEDDELPPELEKLGARFSGAFAAANI